MLDAWRMWEVARMMALKASWRVFTALGALGLVSCGGKTTDGGAVEQPDVSETGDERDSDESPDERESDGTDLAPDDGEAPTVEPNPAPGSDGSGGGSADGAPAESADDDSSSTGSGGVGCGTQPGDRVVRRVPDDYGLIQAAIDAADAGDTVSVGPGTYYENLRLKSGVRLQGAGAGETILDGGGRGQNLIDASLTRGSVVRGFTLRNVGQGEGCARPDDPTACSGDWYASAVYIDGHMDLGACGTSIEIAENSIEDNDIGVMLYYQPQGSAHVHDNRFIDNRVGLAATAHGDGEGEVTHNLFVGSERALALSASYLDVTHNVVAGVGTVLTQEYIQRGSLACNLLYDYADIGDRMVLGQDNNVELAEDPFVAGGFTLSPDAPTPGCLTDAGEAIVPGPRAGVFIDP